MSNRDINAEVQAAQSVIPASYTATIEGEIVSLAGAETIMCTLPVGVVSTADASNYFTMTFETGDDSGLSDAAAVDSGDYLNPRSASGTAWDRVINATTEGSKTYQVGIKNSAGKAYGRIKWTETGTASAILGGDVIKGALRHSPQV